MKDFSRKPIDRIKENDNILDGNLQPVKVLNVVKHFLQDTPLFKFYPRGPVFTPDHQFLSNLERKEVGVVSKNALFLQQPQMEDFGKKIHELKDLKSKILNVDNLSYNFFVKFTVF